MNRFTKTSLLLFCSLSSTFTYSQQYTEDKDFGDCGFTHINFDQDGRPELKLTRVTPGKKILSAGNFHRFVDDSLLPVLVQYLSNGAIDSAGFGLNGVVFSRVAFHSYLHHFALQPDAKIVAVGDTGKGKKTPVVYRYTPTGQPDVSFNQNGHLAIGFDSTSSGSLHHVMPLPGEKILAAGMFQFDSTGGVAGVGLLRLNNNGTPDSLFGNLPTFPGRTTYKIDSLLYVFLFPAGDNYAVPLLRRNNGADTIFLLHVQEDGRAKNNYGDSGLLNTGVPSENLSGVRLANGNLLLGGTFHEPGQVKKMQLLRFTSNLLPDATFGINGRLILPTVGPAATDNVLHGIKELPGGKLLLIGHRAPAGISSPAPLLLRLLPNGQADSSFNGTGNYEANTGEFAAGWQQVDTTDNTGIIISRTPDFRLAKFVPDTTTFQHAPTADFRFIVEKQMVFFENRSNKAQNSQWDFGDGTFSSNTNPVHLYLPGRYTVNLEAFSGCDFLSTAKEVEVYGLHKVLPTVAPTTGFTAFRLYGYGWDNNAKVSLQKGATVLKADTAFFDAGTQSLQANFRFRNAPPGHYDLLVTDFTCPPGQEPCGDTLRLAVTLQAAEAGEPWIVINGPSEVRPDPGGRRAHFTLDYGYAGNITQYLVPLALVIQGKSKGLTPRLLSNVQNAALASSLPDSLKPGKNGFYHFYDQLSQDSVWVMYLADAVVRPNVPNTLKFTVVQEEGDSISVRAFIGSTLFDPTQRDTLYRLRTQNDGCNDCMKCLMSAAGYLPSVFGCAAGILALSCSVSDFQVTPETTAGDVANLALDFASTTVGCATLTGGTFKKLMSTFSGRMLDFFLEQEGNIGSVQDCSKALFGLLTEGCNPSGKETGGRYGMRKSIDPNSKTGPAGSSPAGFIAKNDLLGYTTQFENLPAATAPAYQVEITDTLDKLVMDLSTFRFLRVTIAGNDYPVFNEKDSFAMDIPISSKAIVVRTTGRLDTASGIATWKFTSLDTTTMDLVADIDRGFLPPNTDGIEGTGAVVYSVQQKATNTHLTVISNKAKIVFDRNAPLFTPVWTNTVDTLRPQSRVLNSFHVLSDSTFSVKWAGTDDGSGIRNYKIGISVNDSAYAVLGVFGTDSTVVRAKKGSVYKFISLAKDSVGNLEEPPADPLATPDAVFVFSPALPVDLLSFTATKHNGGARLSWTTAQEIDVDHFRIEHSSERAPFVEIGKVKAAGNSAGKNDYSFLHHQPAKGLNQYRLAMVDQTGPVRFSPVRLLQFQQPATLTVSPNPAANRVRLGVSEPGGTLRLMAGNGKTVKTIKVSEPETNIDLTGLAPGIYLVVYTTKANVSVREKLVIQR